MADSGVVANGVEGIETACESTGRRRQNYHRQYSPRCRPNPGRHLRLGHSDSRLGFPALFGFSLEAGAGVRWGDVLAAVQRLQAAAQFLIEPG
jgi:hypothetical protein